MPLKAIELLGPYAIEAAISAYWAPCCCFVLGHACGAKFFLSRAVFTRHLAIQRNPDFSMVGRFGR